MLVILKPTHQCNMRCKYCFIDNETKNCQNMDIAFAKSIITKIRNYLRIKKAKSVKIIFHGGEPLLWDFDNYVQLFSFIERCLKNIDYKLSIQTNLTLLSEKHIQLFKKYNVSIGFSLDGPAQINDAMRVYKNGRGTYDKIIEKVRYCKSINLRVSSIAILSRLNIGDIKALYDFFKENKLDFKLNPLFNFGEANKIFDQFGITTTEYSNAMIKLFDYWIEDPCSNITISNFSEIASNLVTKKPFLCIFKKNCQLEFVSIAPNGDVFPCGRFHSDDSFRLGNLHKESFRAVFQKKKHYGFENRDKILIDTDCKNCNYFNICSGGCMHDAYTMNGSPYKKSGLCPSYKKIFFHIGEKMKSLGFPVEY